MGEQPPDTSEKSRAMLRREGLFGPYPTEMPGLIQGRLAEAEAEIVRLQKIIDGMATRIAVQSELLSRCAEVGRPWS